MNQATTHYCPDCRFPSLRFLPNASAGAVVNYYHCDACGHSCKVSKDNVQLAPRSVTHQRPAAS